MTEPTTTDSRPVLKLHETSDTIVVNRVELANYHALLVAEIQFVRRLLGLGPLETGSQRRKEHRRHP